MSTLTLTFELPEEASEAEFAIHGNEYNIVLWSLDQWLRDQIKYHDDSYTEAESKLLEAVRKKLFELLEEYSITLE